MTWLLTIPFLLLLIATVIQNRSINAFSKKLEAARRENRHLHQEIASLQIEAATVSFDPPPRETPEQFKRILREHVAEKIQEELEKRARDQTHYPRHWRVELAFEFEDHRVTADRIRERFRYLSKSRHPDNYGTKASYLRLTRAQDEALEEIERKAKKDERRNDTPHQCAALTK